MKFCPNCNNMLYPEEDTAAESLLYACKYCDHKEKADNAKVYHNKIILSPDELSTVLQDVGADPALPRIKESCPECGHEEAVYFQASESADANMTLFFVCTERSCQHRWVGTGKGTEKE